jgi:hypothetical protein
MVRVSIPQLDPAKLASLPIFPFREEPMCGRTTYKLTWEDIVALYRLTLDAPPHNLRQRYNARADALELSPKLVE